MRGLLFMLILFIKKIKYKIILYTITGVILVGLCHINDLLKRVRSINSNIKYKDAHISMNDIDSDDIVIDMSGYCKDQWEQRDNCQLDYSCPEGTPFRREDLDLTEHTYDYLNVIHSNVTPGGSWMPCVCKPRSLLAVIVPYRNRDSHLRIFLNNIIPLLQQQKQAFRIFVIDQAGSELFNRASLLNIGHIEASKLGPYDCFIFHDVDLIPEDWCNLYTCSEQPRHLAAAMNKFDYNLPYKNYCGGALAVHNSTMLKINGFTNVMFGWGGEDDDTFFRFARHKYKLLRYRKHITRYTMISHGDDTTNPKDLRTMKDVSDHWKYGSYDGLNSVNYTVISTKLYKLYTKVTVQLRGPTSNSEAIKQFRDTTVKLRKKVFKENNKEEMQEIYNAVERFRKPSNVEAFIQKNKRIKLR